MSRDLLDVDYYVSQGGMVPVKWTAPEVLVLLMNVHCTPSTMPIIIIA